MRSFGEIWEREGYERVRYAVLCEGERNAPLSLKIFLGLNNLRSNYCKNKQNQ